MTGTPEDPHAAVSRSPVELARRTLAKWDGFIETATTLSGIDPPDVILARALLAAEETLDRIAAHPVVDTHSMEVKAWVIRYLLDVLDERPGDAKDTA